MATEVPELKKLLADNLVTTPQYWSVLHNSRQVMGPTSVMSEMELPYRLEVLVKATIFEAEFVRALENFPEHEYIWVYYEGVDRVAEILEDKPQPMTPDARALTVNYLKNVQKDILQLAKRHMSSEIYTRFITTQTTGDLRRFFEAFQPSEKKWECYVYLAEHCHKESSEKFNTLPLRAHMAVQYFMCLLEDGYEAKHIIKALGRCLRHETLVFPTQDWSHNRGQRFLDQLRVHLEGCH